MAEAKQNIAQEEQRGVGENTNKTEGLKRWNVCSIFSVVDNWVMFNS